MSKRAAGAVIAAGLILALAPIGARATHCGSSIVIFSGLAGVSKPNSNAVVCVADPEQHDYDGRIINPLSNEISVRYTQDLGESTPTITAVLDGLGFDADEVTLTRVPAPTGGFYYNSSGLPLDSALTGCITATIPIVEDSNGFHTIGSSC